MFLDFSKSPDGAADLCMDYRTNAVLHAAGARRAVSSIAMQRDRSVGEASPCLAQR